MEITSKSTGVGHSRLAHAIRLALAVGISGATLMAPMSHAQGNTTANDAVKAAAEAARAAADAAKAAAEAARVAAEAARAAVEAANGLPPSPRAAEVAPAPALSAPQPLGEIPVSGRAAAAAGPASVATPAVGADTPRPATLARGAEIGSAATIITRDEIDASGQTLLSEFLRDLSVNTNGSFRQTTGSTAQSQSTVSLRALGAASNTVLVNGRRIAGSSRLSGGSAPNLNVIPMAAVQRIEVLPEGASALYGDNAVGGVINIVTSDAPDGFAFSGGVARPSRGGGEEKSAAITGALSNERGNISFALDHAEQDIIFRGERDYSAVGLSSFGFPASFFVTGANGQSFGTFPDPRCPANDGSNEPPGTGEFPNSVVLGSRCRYNYAGVSSNEASLSRTSLFVNGDFEVAANVNAFAQAIYSQTSSLGRYAPTPQVGGSPFLPTMSAGNPNNPTNPANATNSVGDDLTPFQTFIGADGQTATGPFDLSIFYRNVPGGFRDSFVDDTFIDLVAGVEASSDFLGGVSLEVTAQHSEMSVDDEATGLADRTALQNAIDDGSFDIFAVNGPTDPNVAATFVRSGTLNAKSTYDALRAQLNVDTLKLGSASLPIRVGVETSRQGWEQDFSEILNQGLVDGTTGGTDISGSRNITSAFGGATLNLGQRVQLDAQLRTDNYGGQIGAVASQRLAGSVAIVPGLTLHGSASRGYIAPTLQQLNAPVTVSFNSGIDVVNCAVAIPAAVNPDGSINFGAIPPDTPPTSPCFSTQYQNLTGGNEDLDVASSTSWTAGVVFDAGDQLSIAATAYQVQIEDQVGTLPLQETLANEFVNGGSDQVIRNANGVITQILINDNNIGSTRTRGLMVDTVAGAYRSGIGPGARLSANYINELEVERSPGSGFAPAVGVLSPNLRANLDLLWRFTDSVTLHVNGNYIGESSFPDQTATLDDWLTWDTQLDVALPWNGSLEIGARNLLDADPPTDTSLNNPFYENELHNPYGVVPYIRYRQEL